MGHTQQAQTFPVMGLTESSQLMPSLPPSNHPLVGSLLGHISEAEVLLVDIPMPRPPKLLRNNDK